MPDVLTPIGRCIYCLRTAEEAGSALTLEHVIPESLNGDIVFPDASCEDCRKITARFENDVSNKMYGGVRFKAGFKSKRSWKTRAKATIPARRNLPDGSQEKIDVPIGDHPIFYVVLLPVEPGLFRGDEPTDKNPEMIANVMGDEPGIALFHEQGGDLELSADALWGSLFRMLAKIGHSYAVGMLGVEGYEMYLPGLILGTDKRLAYFVGGTTKQTPKETTIELSWVPHKDEHYLTVSINLLSGRLPTYQVIVGRVTDMDLMMTRAVALHYRHKKRMRTSV